MPVAIAIWHVALEPGKPKTVIPQADVHVKFAAFGDALSASDASGRTSVKLTYSTPAAVDSDQEDEEDEEDDEGKLSGAPATTFLCSLTPGSCETQVFDLVLERDEEYVFEAVGKNTIYLNGNYVDQVPPDQPPFNEEEEYSEEEDAFDLNEVSSDVAYSGDEYDDEDEDADRFEEIVDAPESSKKLKRARDDATDDGDEAPTLIPAEGAKVSKAEKKKLAKKLKTVNGEAVAVESTVTKTETTPVGKDKAAEKKAEKKEGKKEDKKEDKKEEKTEEKKGKKEKKDKGKDKDVDAGKKTDEPKKAEPEAKTLPGGLIVKDYKVGTGKQAKAGSRLSMRYIGKLTNGKEFDKNVKGQPFSFKLGAGEVIKGWDQGLIGIQIGGERELTVPPALAYGKQKLPGIPPNSTLKFEVKCLAIN